MNHLCGLNLGSGAGLENLDGAERRALDVLREWNQSALRRELDSRGDGDGDGDDANDANGEERAPPAPAHDVDAEGLPPSGMRPLDDATLLRFLRADARADGTPDADASRRRLAGALRFRRERGCDAIARDVAASAVPDAVRRCRGMRVAIWAGVDRESRPVVFERLGQFSGSGNATRVPQEEWITAYLYFLETIFAKMREAAKRSGVAVDRYVYFGDAQGIVSSILNRKVWKVVPLLKVLARTCECHYPEIADHIVLFNVPRVASAVYRAVRGFLDPATAGKIELHPGVPRERFEELLPADVIPVEYGGRNEVDYPQTAVKIVP